MTEIVTREYIREAADNCGQPLDMWRNLEAPARGFTNAIVILFGCLTLWGWFGLCLYIYATSGGNW